MRRAVPVLVATLIGLALLLRYQTTPPPLYVAAPFTLPTEPDRSGSASGAPTEETTSTTRLVGLDPADPAACVPASDGEVVADGPTDGNQYGKVKLRVHLINGQIADVESLKMPDRAARSLRINYFAAPRLRAEALAAQSAQIDTVSGATYTSDSYRISLQGALDQAGSC